MGFGGYCCEYPEEGLPTSGLLTVWGWSTGLIGIIRTPPDGGWDNFVEGGWGIVPGGTSLGFFVVAGIEGGGFLTAELSVAQADSDALIDGGTCPGILVVGSWAFGALVYVPHD
jgi:hypothetical protein